MLMSQDRGKGDLVLSKKLSYFLRHGAVKEGLTIKPNGFVPIEELLKKSLPSYTIDDIKRVVKNNNKQRFTLNDADGVLEIKANQGHSLSDITELSLKVLESVDFDIIHGTYFKHWTKVKTEGLSRMRRNHIHFAKGLNSISGLRKTAEVFIYINFDKAKRDGLIFFESENDVVLCAGNSQGFIGTTYFLKAINKDGQALSFDRE
ncbi:PREDICTED: tRNA 2'-phosphotransferase 1 isoform X2 [Dinoponera quadriceps]|uniref:2'-phosphotransferase n=1 Tax=Dinoponera quadriceps TaxID=609295 RepID=A0A6P3XJB9_DINQU|nr:PREDICTED: tRNA 2'-phosphotransferase 1 isoform X2 [Dinoponera quadriceps]